jgi:hypothetical protein
MKKAKKTYQSRSIKKKNSKRDRRTAAELDVIRDALYQALLDYHPMTVRQVFYQLVSSKVIDKSENAYKNTVVRLLGLITFFADWRSVSDVGIVVHLLIREFAKAVIAHRLFQDHLPKFSQFLEMFFHRIAH